MKLKNKKIIISVLTVFVLSFSLFLFYKAKVSRGVIGSYVFADTLSEIGSLSEITVQSADSEINLELVDGLWRVKEADGYYANYNLLKSFFSDIYNAKYNSKVTESGDDFFENYRIITFKDKNGKYIDSIMLGKKDAKHIYTFAKKEDVFLIDGTYNLPMGLVSWIQNPVFSFEEENVMSMKLIDSEGKPSEIAFVETKINFRDYTFKPYFEAVLSEKNFTKSETQISGVKHFILTSYEGLIAEFKVFHKENDEYWASIKIDTTTMPTLRVSEYVDNNKLLYEGWYFKIPAEVGDVIFKSM